MTKINQKEFYFSLGKERLTQKPTDKPSLTNESDGVAKKKLTLYEFYTEVSNGTTFTPAIFENNKRNSESFLYQQVFALDFDKGDCTPEQVVKLFSDNDIPPTFGYKTFSDSPEKRKFRIVWVLNDTNIGNRIVCQSITRILMQVCVDKGYSPDLKCSDGARMFFGGKGGFAYNGKTLSVTFFRDVVIKLLKELPLTVQARLENESKNNEHQERNKNVVREKVDLNLSDRTTLKRLQAILKQASKKENRSEGTGFTTVFAGLANNFGIPVEQTVAFMHENGCFGNQDEARVYDMYNRYSRQFGTFQSEIDSDNKIASVKTLSQNQKLSEISKDIQTLMGDTPSMIVAPTGSGKTYWVQTLASAENKIIMLQPTLSLVMESAKQYNGYAFYAKQALPKNENLIFCTYASYSKLIENDFFNRKLKEYTLFVDEAHNFTSSASLGFQWKQLSQVIETVDKWKNYHFVTATPLFSTHPTINKLNRVVVKRENSIDKNVFVVKAKEIKASVLKIALEQKEKGNQVMVFLNNTKNEGVLGEYKTLLNGLKTASINSTTKDEQYHREITIDGDLSDFDVLLTTSVLKEGTSITKHSKTVTVIIPLGASQLHPVEVEQLAARFRNAEKLNLCLIVNEKYEEKNTFCNKADRAEQWRKFANNQINDLAQHIWIDEDDVFQQEKLNAVLNSEYIRQKDGKFYCDELLLSYKVFNEERNALISNLTAYIDYLEKFGFKSILKDVVIDKLVEEEKSAEIKEFKAISKAEVEQSREVLLQNLSKETIYSNRVIVEAKSIKTKMENEIRYRLNWINRNLFYNEKTSETNTKAIQKLSEIGFSSQAFTKLVRQYNVQCAMTNTTLKNKDTNAIKFFKQIYKTFKIGERYAKDFINLEMNKISASVFGVEKEAMTIKASSQVFELCFGVKEISERVGDDRTRVYEIVSNNPLNMPISTDVKKDEKLRKEIEKSMDVLLDDLVARA